MSQLVMLPEDIVNEIAKQTVEGVAELAADSAKQAEYAKRLSRAVAVAIRNPGCEVRVTAPTARLMLASMRWTFAALKHFNVAQKGLSSFAQLELTNGSCIRFFIGDTE